MRIRKHHSPLPLVLTVGLVIGHFLTSELGAQTLDRGGKPNSTTQLPPAALAETSPELIIEVKPVRNPLTKKPFTAQSFAKFRNLQLKQTLASDPQSGVVKFGNIASAKKALAQLRKDPRLASVRYNVRSFNTPHVFVPEDPLFDLQWHFDSLTAGVNIENAWLRNLTGNGVVIGIIDDGVERAHEDLRLNFRSFNSRDFVGRDGDPTPTGNDRHGTAVAGVAAARGGNEIGVTGAAPLAGLGGLRVGFSGNSFVSDFVDATKFQSFGSNRNIKVKNHSYGIDIPFILTNSEFVALTQSAKAGTIHIVSAGNSRGEASADSNKGHIQSNPDVITVAALGSDGLFASYSSFGSNVAVTASSSTDEGLGIVTTDRTGNAGYNPGPEELPNRNYTNSFGGTSSSAPLVAGIMALGKQANQRLDGRLAKHILALTSRVVDPLHPEWVKNAANVWFNPSYGFGLINADGFTREVLDFAVTPQLTELTGRINVATVISDVSSVSRTANISSTGKLEEVRIFLDLTTEFRGDLEATVKSPSGTTSKILFSTIRDNARLTFSWWFTSNAFWGEPANGTWTVTVTDAIGADVTRWNSFQIEVRTGDLIDAPPPLNDNFIKASTLPTQSINEFVVVNKATSEAGEPAHAGIPARTSVWYRWTAPKSGPFILSTKGSIADTSMAVYTGSKLTSLSLVGANDNHIAQTYSLIPFIAVKGRVYHIAVDVPRGIIGPITLLGSFVQSVNLHGADQLATEPGRDIGQVWIYRTEATNTPLDVTVTIGGTASTGADYAAITTTKTIQPGQTRVAFVVQPLDDVLIEGPETVTFSIVPSVEYIAVGTTSATVTIQDND